MKKTILHIAAVILLFAFSISLHGQEKAVVNERLSFAPVTLKGNNIPPALMNDVLMTIITRLRCEDYFSIIRNLPGIDKITYDRCMRNQCIAELTDIDPGGIVIIISLEARDVKTGEKQISRYLIEEIKETRYTIHVITADISKPEYELVFKKTFNSRSLVVNEAEIIGKAIMEYYIQRKPGGGN